MCAFLGSEQAPLADLIAIVRSLPDEKIDPLREASDNCPACMLAAIRQSGRQRPYENEDDHGFYFDFDFKKEMKSQFDDAQAARADY